MKTYPVRASKLGLLSATLVTAICIAGCSRSSSEANPPGTNAIAPPPENSAASSEGETPAPAADPNPACQARPSLRATFYARPLSPDEMRAMASRSQVTIPYASAEERELPLVTLDRHQSNARTQRENLRGHGHYPVSLNQQVVMAFDIGGLPHLDSITALERAHLYFHANRAIAAPRPATQPLELVSFLDRLCLVNENLCSGATPRQASSPATAAEEPAEIDWQYLAPSGGHHFKHRGALTQRGQIYQVYQGSYIIDLRQMVNAAATPDRNRDLLNLIYGGSHRLGTDTRTIYVWAARNTYFESFGDQARDSRNPHITLQFEYNPCLNPENSATGAPFHRLGDQSFAPAAHPSDTEIIPTPELTNEGNPLIENLRAQGTGTAPGFRPVEPFFHSNLTQRERRHVPLNARAGHCYRVIGVSGRGILDLDLKAWGADHRLRDQDIELNTNPVLGQSNRLCFTSDETLSVEISLYEGEGEVAVQAYESP